MSPSFPVVMDTTKAILTLFGMSAQSVPLLRAIKKPHQTANTPLIKAPTATVCHAQGSCELLNDLASIAEDADVGFGGDFRISGIEVVLSISLVLHC